MMVRSRAPTGVVRILERAVSSTLTPPCSLAHTACRLPLVTSGSCSEVGLLLGEALLLPDLQRCLFLQPSPGILSGLSLSSCQILILTR